jgi:hypothetical protein
MNRRHLAVIAATLATASLSACSIRVRGVVTDQATGKPIPACAIAIGPKKLQSDANGKYIVSTYTDWHIISFDAAGYEPKRIDFAYSSDRDTFVNAALTPVSAEQPAHLTGPAEASAGPR